ncbi:unnamed protein product [Penicillium discolor]
MPPQSSAVTLFRRVFLARRTNEGKRTHQKRSFTAEPAIELTYHTYVEVLRRGDALTLDAVAREAGLTKPGVVHHFGTKEVLTVAVVNRIIDRWEADLHTRASTDAEPIDKLRAYVDYALNGDFDSSDLALLADVNLRERLSALWAERLTPWLGSNIDTDPASRASLRAARLLADGAWFNAALGIPTVRDDERSVLRAIALQLVNEGDPQ